MVLSAFSVYWSIGFISFRNLEYANRVVCVYLGVGVFDCGKIGGVMKRIKVIESEWGAGTLLSRTTGKKCCLGFLCLALGATEDEIKSKKMPHELGVNNPLKFARSGWIYDAAQANDRYHRNPSEKTKAEHLKNNARSV